MFFWGTAVLLVFLILFSDLFFVKLVNFFYHVFFIKFLDKVDEFVTGVMVYWERVLGGFEGSFKLVTIYAKIQFQICSKKSHFFCPSQFVDNPQTQFSINWG